MLGAKFYLQAVPTATNWASLVWKSGSKWTFDTAGSLRRIEDRFGNYLVIANNKPGFPSLLDQGPNGRTIQFFYFNSPQDIGTARDGKLRQIDIAGKGSWKFTYDVYGRLSQITDPLTRVTKYTWTTYFRGDGANLPLVKTIVDRSNTTRLTNFYDSQGRVIQQTFPDGGSLTAAYSANLGLPGTTTVTDPRGNVVVYNFAWNTTGAGYSLTSITDPLGETTSYVRGGTSYLLTSTTDSQNRTVSFNWDHAKGNLLSVTAPTVAGGTITSTTAYHSQWNIPILVTDALGRQSSATVNAATGNISSTTDARNKTTTYGYATNGDLLSVTNPLNETTQFTYNTNGDLLTVTDPQSHQLKLTYDNYSRCTKMRDANGKEVNLAWNGVDQITSWTQLLNGTAYTSTPTRDLEGRVTSLLTGAGQRWEWAYDAMDRVTQVKNPLGQISTNTWDRNGNVLSHTTPGNQKIEYTYGTADLIQNIKFRRADGTIESTVSVGYDANTHLPTTLTDSTFGSYTWTYDSLDRTTGESGPNGSLSWTLDDLGRRTSFQAPGQGAITYGYDAADNLTSVTQNGLAANFVYDALGRQSRQELPNGVATENTYNTAGFLTSVISRLNGTAFDTHTYQHDLAGNITQHTANGAATQYGYDDFYRLTSSTATGANYAWTYDRAGNRLTQTANGTTTNYTYNTANRLTAVNGSPLTYDANGNLTNFGADTYGWNARGQLASLTRPGVSAAFGYDPLGRRTSKTINGAATAFLFDGDALIGEAVGGVASFTLHGPSVDQPVARNGQYFTPDHLGSVTTATDGTGAVTQRYGYSAFGETNQSTGLQNPFQYAGRENDGTGLYQNRARYYAPELGRFLSEDPIGLGGGTNQYAYVGNNPINTTDPSGLWGARAGGVMIGWGEPDLVFTSQDLGSGLDTGVHATASVFSMGFYNGGAYRCQPGFDGSVALATTGDILLSASGAPGAIKGAMSAFGGIRRSLGMMKGGWQAVRCLIEGSCFPTGTLIETKDGRKPIEQIREGDLVLSADPIDGKQSFQKVTHTFVRGADELRRIETADGRVVQATPEHPFWVRDIGFVEARFVSQGDVLRDAVGKEVPVTSVSIRHGIVRVYNFEVEQNHTYYADGWWVHNQCIRWIASRVGAFDWKHIFSEKHLVGGLMNLGSDQRAIMSSISNVLEQVSGKGLLRQGSNQIETLINGHQTMIRVFFDAEGNLMKVNAFAGSTPRGLGNVIKW